MSNLRVLDREMRKIEREINNIKSTLRNLDNNSNVKWDYETVIYGDDYHQDSKRYERVYTIMLAEAL